jgi:hypothetical protein
LAESADLAVIDGENIANVSPWEFDSVVEEAGNGFDLSAIAAIHNSYGYKISFGGANDAVYAIYAIGNQTDFYVRQYINVKNWTRVGAGANYIQLAFAHDGGSAIIYLTIFLLAGDSNIGAACTLKHGGGWSYLWNDSAISTFSVGTVFRVDVHYKVGGIGTGGASVWANSILKASDYTTYDTSMILPDNLRVGVIKSSPDPSTATIIYIDDILASTTGLIGPFTGWWAPTFHSDTLDGLSTLAEAELNDNYTVTEDTYPQISVYRGWLRNFQGCVLLHGSEK